MPVVRTWIPRVLAVAAFCAYALAAPPSWYWLDSAELSAAGVGLGSPHPTGFPLYCVLIKLATLAPVGELAFRINLLSAACAAVAVYCAVVLVVEACRDDAAALAGGAAAGLVLALSLTFFRQATIAEIYAPTAALFAASLVLLARVARGAGASTGLALAVVAGLGIGTHSSFRLLLALPIAAVLVVRLRRGARWPLVAPALAIAMAAATHAYLPVRSATGRTAAIDWGHPDTAGAFVDHAITAKRIRTAFGGEMFAGGGRHTGTFAAQVTDQLGPLALLAGLAGLAWLAMQRRERWLAGVLGFVLAGDAVYSIAINPMGLGDLQNGIPFAIALAVSAGAGIAWLARVTGRGAPFAGGAAAVLLAVPVALYGWGDRWAASAGEAPRAFAESALDDVPPRGIALVQRDDTAAGLLYVTTAEVARPDVAVLVRQHLWDRERNREVLARARIGGVDAARVLASLEQTPGRPVAWELGALATPNRALRAGAVVGATGVSHRESPPEGDDVRPALAELEHIFGGDDAGDPNAKRAYARSVVGLGRVLLDRGSLPAAEALFRAAIAVRREHIPAYVNLGVVLDIQRRPGEAADVTEQALAIDPNDVRARVNAARFRMRAGDDDAAMAHAERAIARAPGNASAWALAGILDARAGRFDSARLRLAWALLLDPGEPDARDALQQLIRRRGRSE